MLATVAVTEYKFLLVQPSLLAAACLAAACQGLAQEDLLLTILPSALRAQAGQISVLVAHLEVLLSNYSAHFRDSLPATAAVAVASPTSYNNNNNKYQKCREEGTTTPTDCHLAAELVGA
jgi:hypothetical protein